MSNLQACCNQIVIPQKLESGVNATSTHLHQTNFVQNPICFIHLSSLQCTSVPLQKLTMRARRVNPQAPTNAGWSKFRPHGQPVLASICKWRLLKRYTGTMGVSATLAFFCRFVGHNRPRFAGAPGVGVARCRPADRNDARRSWAMNGFDPRCRASCVQQSAFLLLPGQLALLQVTQWRCFRGARSLPR